MGDKNGGGTAFYTPDKDVEFQFCCPFSAQKYQQSL